jgi:hypothetical protein
VTSFKADYSNKVITQTISMTAEGVAAGHFDQPCVESFPAFLAFPVFSVESPGVDEGMSGDAADGSR